MPVLCSIKSELNAKKGMNLFTLCFPCIKMKRVPYHTGPHSGIFKVTMLP